MKLLWPYLQFLEAFSLTSTLIEMLLSKQATISLGAYWEVLAWQCYRQSRTQWGWGGALPFMRHLVFSARLYYSC